MRSFSRSRIISARGYTTRSSQLRRLSEGDEEEWRLFYEKYRSMIRAVGAHRHLAGADLDDLMQAVSQTCFTRLRTFVYEPRRGRFRSFLFTVVRNIADNMRRKNNRETAPIEAAADPPVYDPEINRVFMEEYENFLLDLALKMLRRSVESETYAAFDLLAVQHLPMAEVVARTGKTPGALYGIKHRCLVKLRQFIDDLEREQQTAPAGSATTSERHTTAP